MTVFRFILMALVAFRFTRLITMDDWPPTEWFRNKVAERTGEHSGWSTLVTCPWCCSPYITATLFLVDHYLWTIPMLLLYMGATMAIAGFLGVYSERP